MMLAIRPGMVFSRPAASYVIGVPTVPTVSPSG
jgi:hypothetical protein